MGLVSGLPIVAGGEAALKDVRSPQFAFANRFPRAPLRGALPRP